MLSYEERLESFRNWPDAYKPDFIKKLAILGQYSIEERPLSTMCLFCSKKLEDWKLEDIPIVEHKKHNNSCPIFSLSRVPSKRKIDNIYGVKNTVDTKDNSMITLQIKKGNNIRLCVRCGHTSRLLENSHRCIIETTSRVNLDNIENGQFYLKLFGGYLLDKIDLYLNTDIFIPDKYKDIIEYILDRVEPLNPLESISDMINRGVDLYISDISKEMSEITDKALSILND